MGNGEHKIFSSLLNFLFNFGHTVTIMSQNFVKNTVTETEPGL
jgi:hypothetical protein